MLVASSPAQERLWQMPSSASLRGDRCWWRHVFAFGIVAVPYSPMRKNRCPLDDPELASEFDRKLEVELARAYAFLNAF